MTEDIKHVYTDEREAGYPVDLTEDEFLRFSMTVATKIGPLKTQRSLMIVFAIYFVITLIGFVKTLLDTGEISIALLSMMALTAVSAAVSLTLMPSRVKKGAKASYRAGSTNNYYGELTVTPYAIEKCIGDETVSIPLNEHTMYLEDRSFMAFSAAGQQRSIILPARCMTAAEAARVREVVFAQSVRVNRRVFGRMEALAATPIERRPFPCAAQTLYTVDFQYQEDEIAKLQSDIAWRQYIQSLPGFSMLSILIGLLMAFLEEQVLWFPGVSLTLILGYLVLTVVLSKSRARRAAATQNRTRVTFTDRGIETVISPTGQRQSIGWQGLERAVERADCVEFFYSGQHMLRIPKRAVEDMDELKRIVDAHFQKK